MRRLAFLGAATGMALALVLPAHASRPVTETFIDSSVDVMSCAGFDAVMERTFDVRLTVFFDAEDNPRRVQILAGVTGSLTSSATGKSLPLRGHVRFVFDLATGTATFVGPVFLVTEIGNGAVIKDVGRIVFDGDELVFDAGPHDAIDTEGMILCDALA